MIHADLMFLNLYTVTASADNMKCNCFDMKLIAKMLHFVVKCGATWTFEGKLRAIEQQAPCFDKTQGENFSVTIIFVRQNRCGRRARYTRETFACTQLNQPVSVFFLLWFISTELRMSHDTHKLIWIFFYSP